MSYCRSCSTPVCSTCDFLFPGNVHLCPRCATTPNKKIGSKRKSLIVWGYVLATWSSLGVALLLSGVLAAGTRSKADVEALGMAIGFLVFLPTIIGVGVSIGALDRRLSNPPVVWGAVIWNGLVVAVLILLEIIGNMRHM
jgi:hypothetical protein